jgi:hypothetical protein
VIDLLDEGYVSVYGPEGAVAVLEAEAAMLDRMPRVSAEGLDLESLRTIQSAISRTVPKSAIKNLYARAR